ncbi:four-carbon acid sugar kinase family protein [Lacisediminihabitans profunda]|uniref:Four-carbon acid sugar kinase family protein n=1 Tax=Lacisediminihabitans profunda TaxID=2594790 RepID=A0A5C8UNK4_9MICO|nr:four-carbon acid sugar kinase family protein [Lacisediminihabitans profunda]TXN29975.1 hypothetical protein FVP33_12660 [Lacisediminihabitans profunda]
MSEVVARGRDWAAALPSIRAVGAAEMRAALPTARRVVVLDDDPTGTQTVRGVPVLTRWEADDIAWAFAQGGPGFFVLTNTRSLSEADAAARNREVASRCLDIAADLGVDLVFASRGDSTLRGHFPLETDVLAAVSAEHGQPIDAVLLAPAYLDAGRVTVDGIHWVRGDDGLRPVAHGEFARDATFGYRSSRLADWVEEKSGGRIPAASVVSVGIDAIRSESAELRAGALVEALRAAHNCQVVVIDAIVDDDLRAATLAVLAAESAGRRVLYRVGPSFVRARLGQGTQPPLSDEELSAIVGTSPVHGLVVVGSHVGVTTRQVERLAADRDLARVELDVARIVEGDAEAHIAEVVAHALVHLDHRLVVITTSRTLRTGADAEASLDISRRVSAALSTTVRRIVADRRPRFVVAKGGITSSDIATVALDIHRAWVRGSLLPGIVSLWQATSGTAEGLAYIVFAGNVGGDSSLAEVVNRLERA